uniref:Uncharacterized protein n=1 Tax=Amphimedon queenslandica TaxID=400682 RepID=A0A1X7ULU9_AMPQE
MATPAEASSSVYNSSEEDVMPDDEIITPNLHKNEENPWSLSAATVVKSRSRGHKQHSASQRKVNATFLKSYQLDSLVDKTRTKLKHLCQATNQCTTLNRLVNDHVISFYLLVQYHKQLFITIYEDCSKGRTKEKYLRLQIQWHNRCSIFLLPEDTCISAVQVDYSQTDADIRKIWYNFCHGFKETSSCKTIMIHLSSLVFQLMLEHLHQIIEKPSQHTQGHDTEQPADKDNVYYRFGGATLSNMLQERYKSIRRCSQEKIATISNEIPILQAIATKSRADMPSYLRYRDHGYMYTPDPSFIPFFKQVDTFVQQVVNPSGFQKHRDDLVKVAHDFMQIKEKELKEKFNKQIQRKLSLTDEVVQEDIPIKNVYQEMVRKLSDIRIEEFLSVQRQKMAHEKGQATTSGQNLRDNLLTHHTYLRTNIEY